MASAPAKVMLFGEYAVLEGHRAVAMCLDRRISCRVERGGGRLAVRAPGVFEPAIDLPAAALDSAVCPDPRLELLWPLLRRHSDSTGLCLDFSAEFPPTWGLGSSSASGLAAAAALSGPTPAIFGEVLAAQRALQGQASGYDVATQLLGGFVLYRGGPTPKMERLDVPEMDWLLAWTGTKVATGPMIGKVRERFPSGHAIYSRIGALSESAIALLCGGQRRALGEALNEGHALLAELGAVPDALGDRVRGLQQAPSVYGARMTGAGGGDSVLLLVEDRAAASAAVQACGLEVLKIGPEAQGLRMESAA